MKPTQILQNGGGIVRDGVRLTDRLGRRVAGDAYGIVRQARHLRQAPKSEMDDVTLARKVESELFRSSRAAKATVNVNAVDGVVWLRGEVKRADQIRRLEEKTRSIPEVRGVENLLHLPKTPSPTRADSPKRQQRPRSSTRRPTPRRTPGRVSDDRSDALVGEREQSPVEHARSHQGRTPAPLGSTGEPRSGEGGETGSEAGGDGAAGEIAPPALPARAASAQAADSDS